MVLYPPRTPDVSLNLNCRPMRFFLYEMKHSASSRDPHDSSNQDANPIRIEKSVPFFSFQMLLVLFHAYFTSPTRDVQVAIERSWWVSIPVSLNLGLGHVTFEQRQTHGRIHSGGPPNGMSMRFMERRGRSSHVNIAEVASIRWLLDHSTVHLCRGLELGHPLDLLPLVWI